MIMKQALDSEPTSCQFFSPIYPSFASLNTFKRFSEYFEADYNKLLQRTPPLTWIKTRELQIRAGAGVTCAGYG